jgi:hypothetical protein
VVLVSVAAACSDDNAECVSNDVGEVCAEQDGGIRFNGQGLSPGSEVRYESAELDPITFTVDAEGAFGDEPGAIGVLSLFTGTEFTFDVVAVDADGNALTGKIVIATG